LFLIAGSGPLEERLRRAVAGRRLQGKVVLLGHQQDPAEVLAALDLFVLSSCGEGMGSVLLEAAACGVPAVATSAGGIAEVIEHRRSGLLARVRDPTEL